MKFSRSTLRIYVFQSGLQFLITLSLVRKRRQNIWRSLKMWKYYFFSQNSHFSPLFFVCEKLFRTFAHHQMKSKVRNNFMMSTVWVSTLESILQFALFAKASQNGKLRDPIKRILMSVEKTAHSRQPKEKEWKEDINK